MAYRPLPIGIDDFKELISSEYYYVDKTDFVKELLEKGGEGKPFHPAAPFREIAESEHAPVFF
ncbi:MAG TPA: AAA family ATPase [Candidatus Eisenbergiella intestinipullorum]|nr:AAA family ATPase [Candidatus Eisenbergiella intestinipullorum]